MTFEEIILALNPVTHLYVVEVTLQDNYNIIHKSEDYNATFLGTTVHLLFKTSSGKLYIFNAAGNGAYILLEITDADSANIKYQHRSENEIRIINVLFNPHGHKIKIKCKP